MYGTWTDSELRSWLIDHGYVKSDFAASRDELLQRVSSAYGDAQDEVWRGWRDSDLRGYLYDHGILKTREEKTREELVQLMQEHASGVAATARDYIDWSDARLRGFLHAHGVAPSQLASDRDSLLRQVRAYYAPGWTQQLQHKASAVVDQLKTGVRDLFGVPQQQAYGFDSEKLGSYAAAASKSASSLASSASSYVQHVRDEL